MTKFKEQIERYLKLTFWALCNFDNLAVPEEHYEVVLDEIGRLEEVLLASGYTPKSIRALTSYAALLSDKPLNELSENQQLMLIQAIFGTATKLEKDKD